ncbi:MAG: MFS transporter [Candidatus Thiodiazotropha sp.]
MSDRLWPIILCGVAGSAVFNLAPLYLSASAQHFALDDRQVGWLMSAEIAGIALASLLVRLISGRIPLRQAAMIGALCLAIGNAVSLCAGSYNTFLIIRFVIGFLGDGMLYVTAIVLLGRSANPVRAFATLSFTNMCFTASMLWLMPMILVEIDNTHLSWLFGGLGLAVLISSRTLDLPQPRQTLNDAPMHRLGHIAPLIGLIGYALFGANLGAIWSFAERLGGMIGMATGDASMLLGISIMFQALGSVLAILTSRRIAPQLALMALLATQSLAALLMAFASGPDLYLAAFALWGASWNFGAAHLLGTLSRLPRGSRILSLAPGSEAVGVALGPLIVSSLLGSGMQSQLSLVLPVVAITCVALTTLCYLGLIRRSMISTPLDVSDAR